MVKCGNLA